MDRFVPNIRAAQTDLKLHSDLQSGRIDTDANWARLQKAAGEHVDKVDHRVIAAAKSPTVPSDRTAMADSVGVVNPFAIAQLRLGRKVNIKQLANRLGQAELQRRLEKVLEFPYAHL